MKKDTLNTMIKENANLKSEITSILAMVQENETKQKGFRLIENAFLLAESIGEIDGTALGYLEDVFNIDKATLFISNDVFYFNTDPKAKFSNVYFTNEKTLRYAYVEKRPYYGTYLEGLISDFHVYNNIGSYLIAPVIENGKIVASLNLYSSDPKRFSNDASSDFVQQLMIRIKISLRRLDHLAVIKKQSQTDFLTGIPNKSVMHNLIDRFTKSYKNEQKSFTFLMLDVDNFKAVNDTRGHIIGDRVLKEIADMLVAAIEKDEFVGRFGGDEFYMVINTVTPFDVKARFLKILFSIDHVAKEYGFAGVIGMSGGYASVPADMDDDFDAIDIVRVADKGLTISKTSGKRICCGVANDNNKK